MTRGAVGLLGGLALTACGSSHATAHPGDAGPLDATIVSSDGSVADSAGSLDAPEPLDAFVPTPTSGFCALPGSVVYGPQGARVVVPGGATTDLSQWLTLPDGFCVHFFANVPNARQIRFAPGGELFVASPTQPTTGGGLGGKAAILVLADDDANGAADEPYPVFLDGLPATQGLLFARGSLYYQDNTAIRRLDYHAGDRKAPGPGELVVDVTVYESALHWPKALDVADDGTLYVTNGADQGQTCLAAPTFTGGILAIDGTDGGRRVAQGMRNPFMIRCRRGHNDCFAIELTADYSGASGGREKLFRVKDGIDLGYPCCATTDQPFGGIFPLDDAGRELDAADCSYVAPEIDAFRVGRTPMGFDFEPGLWPAPWRGSVILAMHGAFGSWAGSEVVAVETDPATGRPLPASELDGGDPSAIHSLARGWDDGTHQHGRPEDVTFSSDGRVFVSNDATGDIVWIAPVGLGSGMRQAPGDP